MTFVAHGLKQPEGCFVSSNCLHEPRSAEQSEALVEAGCC
ncbi:MAG: hypothetical protein HONBIEJF_00614 [Fimbriimonadaceae bacterium]|nr:hypothetical protein [Fimbriimonadaceae bacterium]